MCNCRLCLAEALDYYLSITAIVTACCVRLWMIILSITSSIFVLLFMSLARSQQPHTQSEYAATKAAGCWLVSLTIMAIRHVDLAEATTQQCMATILLIVLPKAADDDSLRTPWQYRTRVLEYPGINMATRVRYWYSSTCAGTIR